MSNATLGHFQANRRAALSAASRYLDRIGTVFPDYRAWSDEVTDLADRLLPWLNAGLPTEEGR